MTSIEIPQLADAQLESWLALTSIAETVPNDWILIGGQMVQLHCWERGFTPPRVTSDVDAVIDVISKPEILEEFTKVLDGLGFEPQTSPDGHQYKWKKDLAEIDILFPDNVGARALNKKGFTSGTIPETPGGRVVLSFAERVEVELEGRTTLINRPNLIGSLFIKIKAMRNPNDIGFGRHFLDFAILATLFSSDDVGSHVDPKVVNSILSAVALVRGNLQAMSQISGAEDGLERVTLALTP